MCGKPGKEGRVPDVPFIINVKWIWTETSCVIFEDAFQGPGVWVPCSPFCVHASILQATTTICSVQVPCRYCDCSTVLRSLSLWSFHNAYKNLHSSGSIPFSRTHVIDQVSILAPNKSPFGQTSALFFLAYDRRLFYPARTISVLVRLDYSSLQCLHHRHRACACSISKARRTRGECWGSGI